MHHRLNQFRRRQLAILEIAFHGHHAGELQHRLYGIVVILASDLAQQTHLLQQLLHLFYAPAGIALAQGDVALALFRVLAIQRLERLYTRNAVFLQAGLSLEADYGFLRAIAIIAVHFLRQIAQLAQTVLQLLHADAGAALLQLAIAHEFGRIACKQLLLQLCIRLAILANAQRILEIAHRGNGIPAVYAVRLAARIAQIVQTILQRAHRFAAIALCQIGIGTGGHRRRRGRWARGDFHRFFNADIAIGRGQTLKIRIRFPRGFYNDHRIGARRVQLIHQFHRDAAEARIFRIVLIQTHARDQVALRIYGVALHHDVGKQFIIIRRHRVAILFRIIANPRRSIFGYIHKHFAAE